MSMSAIDLAIAACTAFAAIAGFLFELRRQSSVGALTERVTGLARRLDELEAWRDRVARSS